MNEVAPACVIAAHHQRWENIWRAVRVYLTTFDIGHQVTDRDVQLAKYFDRAYAHFMMLHQPKAVIVSGGIVSYGGGSWRRRLSIEVVGPAGGRLSA